MDALLLQAGERARGPERWQRVLAHSLWHLRIETDGDIDLRGLFSLDPTVKAGYDSLRLLLRPAFGRFPRSRATGTAISSPTRTRPTAPASTAAAFRSGSGCSTATRSAPATTLTSTWLAHPRCSAWPRRRWVRDSRPSCVTFTRRPGADPQACNRSRRRLNRSAVRSLLTARARALRVPTRITSRRFIFPLMGCLRQGFASR